MEEKLKLLHQLERDVAEMESLGWVKWLCFDPAQLSHWLGVRRLGILELRQQLEAQMFSGIAK